MFCLFYLLKSSRNWLHLFHSIVLVQHSLFLTRRRQQFPFQPPMSCLQLADLFLTLRPPHSPRVSSPTSPGLLKTHRWLLLVRGILTGVLALKRRLCFHPPPPTSTASQHASLPKVRSHNLQVWKEPNCLASEHLHMLFLLLQCPLSLVIILQVSSVVASCCGQRFCSHISRQS